MVISELSNKPAILFSPYLKVVGEEALERVSFFARDGVATNLTIPNHPYSITYFTIT
jgi:hypothetical protein